MKLSRKGWNNVILFSALLMIIVFNIIGKSKGISSELVGILPDNAEIMAISIEQQLWTKSNNGWQSHLQKTPSQAVNKTIALWQNNKFTVWPDAVGGSSQVIRIKVQVAQLANPIDLSLFHGQGNKLITNWQGQLLLLNQEEFDLLFTPLMQQANSNMES